MKNNSEATQFSLLSKIWASPNTFLGLLVGLVSLFFGSKAQKVDGCWEFHSGLVQWLLQQAPIGSGALAMTLGHCILGQTESALDITRKHEHVHVRQYGRWGPFFIPVYFIASLLAWIKGGNAYRDNVFEVEAYDEASYDSNANSNLDG